MGILGYHLSNGFICALAGTFGLTLRCGGRRLPNCVLKASPQAKIAQVLGVAKATISRDVKASSAVSNETSSSNLSGHKKRKQFQMKLKPGNSMRRFGALSGRHVWKWPKTGFLQG